MKRWWVVIFWWHVGQHIGGAVMLESWPTEAQCNKAVDRWSAQYEEQTAPDGIFMMGCRLGFTDRADL